MYIYIYIIYMWYGHIDVLLIVFLFLMLHLLFAGGGDLHLDPFPFFSSWSLAFAFGSRSGLPLFGIFGCFAGLVHVLQHVLDRLHHVLLPVVPQLGINETQWNLYVFVVRVRNSCIQAQTKLQLFAAFGLLVENIPQSRKVISCGRSSIHVAWRISYCLLRNKSGS